MLSQHHAPSGGGSGEGTECGVSRDGIMGSVTRD